MDNLDNLIKENEKLRMLCERALQLLPKFADFGAFDEDEVLLNDLKRILEKKDTK